MFILMFILSLLLSVVLMIQLPIILFLTSLLKAKRFVKSIAFQKRQGLRASGKDRFQEDLPPMTNVL